MHPLIAFRPGLRRNVGSGAATAELTRRAYDLAEWGARLAAAQAELAASRRDGGVELTEGIDARLARWLTSLDEWLARALQAIEARTSCDRIDRLAELDELTTELRRRELELDERERRLSNSEPARPSQRPRAAGRSRRAPEPDESLRERARELDERDAELTARELQLEIDLELRDIEVERRERALADRERRLERREAELGVYVAELQSQLGQGVGRSAA
jgi:DNA repair exonuclease SbcCD ATPase subunit